MMSLARRSITVVASAAAMTSLWYRRLSPRCPRRATLRSRRQPKRSRPNRPTLPASTPTDSGTTTKPTGKTAPPDVMHRVPSGYSKLGLTDQQKEKLYKIQAEYYPKIQALEKQLDDSARAAARRNSCPVCINL